ncbi:amidase [Salipaludibacillus sp. CUR1]|uniref:amidase n=1 Tax=Salipaludibacillus sp. CUR1 TaxID=2820003 RepID=UPI001E2F5AA2|nr:amidase family protein [Salipaludibacillus sp. CUR1]MCE7794834.1 amidase [Salipaludibacillus sp. CUR1]
MDGFYYHKYDATGLAELIKKREVTGEEVFKEALIRIEALNPYLNAVVHKFYSKALKQINNPEMTNTPLSGVPMLLKDITQDVKGERITSGSRVNQHFRAETDSNFVSRLKEAGLVPMGHTNVPEFALMGVTEPEFYGPARNPWNIKYTPGGSSGGSSAAVASGMVPVAGANDGGGSIRIPAAYCGLFGLKPTRGRTPVGPSQGRLWQGASSEHVLTRSVRDSALILDLIHGDEKGAAFLAPGYEGSYVKEMAGPLCKPSKIAFSVKSPIGTAVDHECKEAVLKTVRFLEKSGFEVEEKDAPVDGKKIAQSYLTMYFGEVAATLSQLEQSLARKITMKDVEPTTWLLGMLGKATSAQEFVLNLKEWDTAALAMEEFHETYDFYVTPATAMPPAKIGELQVKPTEKLLIKLVSNLKAGKLLKKSGAAEQLAEESLMRTPFTQQANLTGQPAMSVPVHKTGEGLPVGVQFIAAKGNEHKLFQMAYLLERTDLWIKPDENPFYSL